MANGYKLALGIEGREFVHMRRLGYGPELILWGDGRLTARSLRENTIQMNRGGYCNPGRELSLQMLDPLPRGK
jgi:hypothetical protein